MVIGGLEVVERRLTHLLRDRALLAGLVEGVERLLLLLVGELAPAFGFRAAHALGVGFGNDADGLRAAEALLADVRAPRYGVAVGQRVVDRGHHLLERQVVNRAPHPVVGNLDDEARVEGMVRERREVHVVFHVDRQRCGERFGRVLLTLVGERFGHRAEVLVEEGVEAAFPGRREGLAALRGLEHAVEVGFEHDRQLVEIGFLGSVVQARIDLEGDDAVGLDALRHVVRSASLGEVQLSVQADVLLGLVHERVADDPHFREVHLGASGLEDFALKERQGREAPAGAAAALVLDGRGRDELHVGEFVTRRGVVLIGGLRRGRAGEADCECGKQQVFHSVLGFCVVVVLRIISSTPKRSSDSRPASGFRAWFPAAGGSSCPCRRYRRRSGRS